VDLVLDVRRGATAEALLGALIEAGASLEAMERAVSALGRGEVRLQVQGSSAGSSLRIRAPHGAPTHETWDDLRPRVALLPLDQDVVDGALATLDVLFAARAAVHGVDPADVDVDPFSGPDDLANAIALAAATVALAPDRVLTTAVGHGTGTHHSIEGDVELPGPVVTRILADTDTVARDASVLLVDPVGAAYAATAAGRIEAPDDQSVAARGRGRLPDGTSLETLLLERRATGATAG
jgi:pyridinium-3,5-bisthiocarboxylic acid mononucleotide nickel chelatase